MEVSKTVRKGKPIIATRAGGIPLQIDHERNGFLVEVGITEAVAQHLLDLWTDHDLYNHMCNYYLVHISDELSTVENALNWLYLSSKLSQGEQVHPADSGFMTWPERTSVTDILRQMES